MILSLTLDEENSERLMLKYYVFLLKDGISDPVAAVRKYRGFVDSYLQTVEGIKKERIEDFVIDRIMKIVNNPESINEIFMQKTEQKLIGTVLILFSKYEC